MNRTRQTYFRVLLGIILAVATSASTYSQEVRSNRVGFMLRYLPDSLPPTIAILSPDLNGGTTCQVNTEEIHLIGEVRDNDSVRFIAVNSDKRAVSDTGAFTSIIKLFPGKNEVRLVASDMKNNLQELYIFIDYDPLKKDI